MAKELLDEKILLDSKILRPEEYKNEIYYIEYLGNGLILRQNKTGFYLLTFIDFILALIGIIYFDELLQYAQQCTQPKRCPNRAPFFIFSIAAPLCFIVFSIFSFLNLQYCFNKRANLFWKGKYVELDPFGRNMENEEYKDEQRPLSKLLNISIKRKIVQVKYGTQTYYPLTLVFRNDDEVELTSSTNSHYILFLASEIASYLEVEVKVPTELKANFEREIKMRSQNPDAIKITVVE